MTKTSGTPAGRTGPAVSSRKTILITGANGQLGQCFRQLAADFSEWQFEYLDISELDITDRAAVLELFQNNPVDCCINCAAYAAVDKAESEPEAARRVNVNGAKNLALACADRDIPFVHFSTDYVYHSRQNVPFREGDREHPQGVYARTKLAGDKAVLKEHPGAAVIRTSWLYAPHGQNFVQTILRYGSERPELNVVYDQVGTPTYAPDLALAVLRILRKVDQGVVEQETLAGVWHYSNEGVCSWYDFALAIAEMAGLTCRINPIETKDYPLPAPRPPFSVLSKEKIKKAFDLEIPYWRDSLKQCMAELGKN